MSAEERGRKLVEDLAKVDDMEQASYRGMGIITGSTPTQIERERLRSAGCGGSGTCAIGIRDVNCPNCPPTEEKS